MANSLSFAPLISSNVVVNRPGTPCSVSLFFHCASLFVFECAGLWVSMLATGNKPLTKPNSILCAECDGDGAKKCTQCEGSGVNSVDHFNGQFKAGNMCWLCRGKKEILCGSCNGAGFIGGFMSTFDD
ncbi:chaperone protein DnaJ [Striga asiatica]|uniref:Chaperone protein DnaJ n=1 Tax=Striga asiatica TaxID=4170 RepID=A0A5A7PJ42_STRAF|nr:chaperone protein DnaJ [Striga asiatica]